MTSINSGYRSFQPGTKEFDGYSEDPEIVRLVPKKHTFRFREADTFVKVVSPKYFQH